MKIKSDCCKSEMTLKLMVNDFDGICKKCGNFCHMEDGEKAEAEDETPNLIK